MHHGAAAAWFAGLQPDKALALCRRTQLGLLRLLTAAAVMGDEVMTQPQAWTVSWPPSTTWVYTFSVVSTLA
ncbi:MAG: hypothetical protein ABJC89_26425 [Acidobacteriota bacterium]